MPQVSLYRQLFQQQEDPFQRRSSEVMDDVIVGGLGVSEGTARQNARGPITAFLGDDSDGGLRGRTQSLLDSFANATGRDSGINIDALVHDPSPFTVGEQGYIVGIIASLMNVPPPRPPKTPCERPAGPTLTLMDAQSALMQQYIDMGVSEDLLIEILTTDGRVTPESNVDFEPAPAGPLQRGDTRAVSVRASEARMRRMEQGVRVSVPGVNTHQRQDPAPPPIPAYIPIDLPARRPVQMRTGGGQERRWVHNTNVIRGHVAKLSVDAPRSMLELSPALARASTLPDARMQASITQGEWLLQEASRDDAGLGGTLRDTDPRRFRDMVQARERLLAEAMEYFTEVDGRQNPVVLNSKAAYHWLKADFLEGREQEALRDVALRTWQYALRIDANFAPARARRAMALMNAAQDGAPQAGRYASDAYNDLSRLSAQLPSDPLVLGRFGQLQLMLGMVAQSRQTLSRAVDETRDAYNRILLADSYRIPVASDGDRRAGLLGRAQTLLTRVLDDAPRNSEALSAQGATLAAQGHFQEAEHLYIRAINEGGANPNTLARLAAVYGSQGFVSTEISYYTQALDSVSSHIPAHIALAHIHLDQLDAPGALVHATRLIALTNGRDPAVFTFKAQAEMLAGQYAKAVRTFSDTIRDARETLAQLSAEQTHELSGTLAQALLGRAQAHVLFKLQPDAERDFEEAAQLGPGVGEYNLAHGYVLFGQGKFTDALEAFAKAKGTDQKACAVLGELMARRADGQYAKALELIDGQDMPKPLPPLVEREHAVLLHLNGQHREAITAFTALTDKDARDDFAWAGRGEAFRQRGKDDRAREDFKKALEINPNNTFASRKKALIRNRVIAAPAHLFLGPQKES